MKTEVKVSRTVTETVIIELQDAEPIQDWAGWTHNGKTVQITRVKFEIRDGMLSGLTVAGTVLKKDGTPGSQTADYRISVGWRGWDAVHSRGEGKISSQLEPYAELAREQLRVLEAKP